MFAVNITWPKSFYNPGQKSSWQYCNIHIFLSFLSFLLKQSILFEIFLQFSLPPPYTKLKLGENWGHTRPTLFMGWGEGSACVNWKRPRNAKVSQEFVHDCSFSWLFHRLILPLSTCSFLFVLAPLVCYTAVFRVITQRSSPQTAAEDRTTFLSLCVCGLTNKPIRFKKFDSTWAAGR